MKLSVTFTDDRGLQFTGTITGTFCKGCRATLNEPGESDHIELDQLDIDSVVIPGDDSKGSKYAIELPIPASAETYSGWCAETLDANTETIHEQAMEAYSDELDGQREAAAEARAELRRDRSIG